MNGKRFIHSIRLRNLLSYGPQSEAIELQPLNVLIGPNGSGKSNLIAALELLQAAPQDLRSPITRGGGISSWLWRGRTWAGSGTPPPIGRIEITIRWDPEPLGYSVALSALGDHFQVVEEAVESVPPQDASEGPYYLYRKYAGNSWMRPYYGGAGGSTQSGRAEQTTSLVYGDRSVLEQVRGPNFPEITELARRLQTMRLFRSACFGPSASIREPNSTDLPDDFPMEDGRNLSLVVHRLLQEAAASNLQEKTRQFIPDLDVMITPLRAGAMQVMLRLRDETLIPMARLSDGTLRYLTLVAILCDPEPPPLICIEEPELGLHPDMMPVIAEMLIEASTRTQLIVTTHSDLLVSQFDETPEAILVCQRDRGGTTLRRVRSDDGEADLSLGERWLKGQIGGTRW